LPEGRVPAARSQSSLSFGDSRIVAVSPDHTRVVSLEEGTVFVRELPSLREIERTSLGSEHNPDAALGFLSDGRPIALVTTNCAMENCIGPGGKKLHGCRRTLCADPVLMVIDHGAAIPLAPSLDNLVRAAFTPTGDLALVVRKGGAVAVVALPSGQEIATVPWPADADTSALALSPAGDRAALAANGAVTVFARSGSAFTPVFTARRRFTRSLTFSADGRTLFTGDDLTAYREGATPRVLLDPVLAVTPPPGWVLMAPGGAVARYRDAKHSANVMVSATDADEYDPTGDAESWARRVASRIEPYTSFDDTADGPTLLAWGAPGARAAYIRYSDDSGGRHHVRIQERDERLWVVSLETLPGLSAKRLAAWRRAFMDAPFGATPGEPTPKKAGRRRWRR
jgi:hypothetical protein